MSAELRKALRYMEELEVFSRTSSPESVSQHASLAAHILRTHLAATPAQPTEVERWRPIETAPKEPGRYIHVRQTATYRWLPYKPNSQEFKRGKKGRWQKHTGYGFDNAELEGDGWCDALSTEGGGNG